MKSELRDQAIELRREGMSIPLISKKLSVAKSSISLWVRGVSLSDSQMLSLKNKSNIAAVEANKQKGLNRRADYQKIGRNRIKSENGLYLAGCMLYWGEGSKEINAVKITNSDVNVILLFKKFLQTYFEVPNDKITITVNCYDDFHSLDEIENWWLGKLGLDKTSLRKGQLNLIPKSSKSSKKNKLEYGTCALKVNETKIVQEIFGAIQEYGGFVNNKWLNYE